MPRMNPPVRCPSTSASEGVAQIPGNVPLSGAFERHLQLVERIVRVLEIRIAQDDLQDKQPIQLARADERVFVIRPLTFVLKTVQIRVLLAESRRQPGARRRGCIRIPFREQVDRRLMVPEGPENPR